MVTLVVVKPPASRQQVDRLDFSNETFSSPGDVLSQARQALAALSSSSYGYFGGGFTPTIPGRVCTIDRLDFSNETLSTPFGAGNGLSQARNVAGSMSQVVLMVTLVVDLIHHLHLHRNLYNRPS